MKRTTTLEYDDQENVVNLLPIDDGECRHYTAIKDFSRLFSASNRHGHKQHFCMNCLQGFSTEISRDDHFKYCKDNETVRIEIPKRGSFMRFHDGQYLFKVPFIMYADFQVILKPIEAPDLIQKNHALKLSISIFPLVSVSIASLLIEKLKIH